MKITDKAVSVATAAVADTGKGTHHSKRLIRKILEAALPHLSQEAVSVKPLEWEAIGSRDLVSDTELGQYVINRDPYSAGGFFNLWMAGAVEDTSSEYPTLREAKAAAQADYERRILSSLSPAHVGVTDEMVQKFITTSRDEDAGYRDWTEAVTAGLNAALASHEPAPTDTQDRLSVTGEAEAPASPPLPESETDPAWVQLLKLFQRYNHPEPPIHLRDELVTFMTWAWYGQKAQSALTACQQELERLRDLLDRAIPETMEYDAESGGFYDTELTHDIRSALGGQSNE